MLHQRGAAEPAPVEFASEGEVPKIEHSVKSNTGLARHAQQHRALKMAIAASFVVCLLVAGLASLFGSSMASRSQLRVESCSYLQQEECPALQLLASPSVFQAATDTLMQAGRFFLGPEDTGFVHATVIAGFANITARLDQRTPEVIKKLEELKLTERQKDVALSSLRLIASTRVQSLGREVAKAIRDSPTPDPLVVKQHVEERMLPHVAILNNLRDELEPLLREWSAEDKWVMALDQESIRVMQNRGGGEFISVSPQDMVEMPGITDAHITPAQLSYVLLGGVLEEARALIHMVNFLSSARQGDLYVPTWGTSMMDMIDLDPELLSCEVAISSVSVATADIHVHLTKALFCPLKFGVLGLEAVRATAPRGDLNPGVALHG